MKRKVYVGLDVHKETIRIAYLRVILKGNVERTTDKYNKGRIKINYREVLRGVVF
ncbi:hypothetical protein [Leptospira mayottensis]|uniref:IS110 family transposase n=1 Tax=Leptospira mayottensis 200901122 TaxID=1193010 RepID=A0AA87MR88_9LEPT|nr:hypothetical protein LEP1GSC125_2922 [Leptospira mayottensis 200901122]